VPLAKKEIIIQGIIDRQTEIGRCYRTEFNVEKKSKAMSISR
jgi:hypothetical protein